MSTILIGLGSKAQIGKDYAAAQLAKDHDVERVAFADSLKKDLAYLFDKCGFNFSEILLVPELKEKVRPLLVAYGQTMRIFEPEIWVRRAFDREFKSAITIVTDVRFPNEVAKIKEQGGVYIEIDTDVPPANETEALYSPQMLKLADAVVRNNFDGNYIRDLKAAIERLTGYSFY